jgi:hypothetical protein
MKFKLANLGALLLDEIYVRKLGAPHVGFIFGPLKKLLIFLKI